MAILITGGTGFLGSYLARFLLEQGVEEIVLFDRFPSDERIGDIRDAVTVVEGDMLEPQELSAVIARHGVDRIAHLASMPGLAAPEKFVPYLRQGCMGTANVFETARLHGIKRVVTASSAAVYGGGIVDRPVTEDDHPRPGELYGACKLWSEHVAQYYNGVHGMEIVCMRICSTVGLGRLNRASLQSGLMAPETVLYTAFLELAALGEPVTMPPDDQLLDFLYAADAAQAWWLGLTAERFEHWVFNLRGEQRLGADWTRVLRELLPDAQIGVSDKPMLAPQVLDSTRLVEELGFRPRYTLETGLADYLERVRAVGAPTLSPA
jgi:nucleoside-diphosphate-sugar epimerase